LSQHHAGCDSVDKHFSLDCVAASSRWCRSRGRIAGWPMAYGLDALAVVCANEGVFLGNIPVSTLTAQHSDCTASNVFSMACNSAIHRYCQAQGFVSGTGPLELSGTHVNVHCASRAFQRTTSFANLNTYTSGCSGWTVAHSNYCRDATIRYCLAHAHRGALGPVEISATEAVVTCLP
jgi:hypothetical protein